MDELRLLIKGKERDTYSIHYSCNGFYSGDSVAPVICCIAMVNLKSNDKHIFALHNYIKEGKCLVDAEKQLLSDFIHFFNGLKNSNVVKRDEISVENGIIEYKKSVHFQEDEHTNAYTEHYLYRIYNIKKVRRFVYNTVIIGDITREYLNKDDGEEVKVMKKIRIPNYFGLFEKEVENLILRSWMIWKRIF